MCNYLNAFIMLILVLRSAGARADSALALRSIGPGFEYWWSRPFLSLRCPLGTQILLAPGFNSVVCVLHSALCPLDHSCHNTDVKITNSNHISFALMYMDDFIKLAKWLPVHKPN